ncbi:MAG: alpha/beta hydrolase [Leptospiraceae bacterium]|nr:alpha/beta hydrolase [Leptospiraceae bacterium]
MNWIFLRGLGRQSGHWFRFRELLEKERRARRVPFQGSLLFPDLPGTGLENHRRSPDTIQGITDDLRNRTLARLPPGQPRCLFAISLGGMVALDWLSRYPGDFQHAFIVNSSLSGLSPFYRRMQPRAALGLLGGIVRARAMGDLEALEERVFQWTCNEPDEQGKVQHWVRLQKEHPLDLHNFLRQLKAAMGFKAPPRFPETGVGLSQSGKTPDAGSGNAPKPVFLVSRRDRLVHPSCSDVLYQRYGQPGKYFVHPFAGHDLTSDDPEGTMDFLRRYMQAFA